MTITSRWVSECMLYLAATLPRSISAGTHSSLQVAGLAVGSCDVTLAAGALWEKWKQTTPSFCYQQRNRLREELPECVLALCFTKPLKLHCKMEMPLSSHSHVSWNITEVHLNTKYRVVQFFLSSVWSSKNEKKKMATNFLSHWFNSQQDHLLLFISSQCKSWWTFHISLPWNQLDNEANITK